MPDATASLETVTKDLKTCPPDGFVELKVLPYGKMLHRRDNASRMSMEQQANRGRRKQAETDEQTKVSIETMQTWTRWYEFKECIVDHNLTDSNGRKLDFNSKMDFQLLNPKVGAEIEKYIDELNQEEDEDEDSDFPYVSSEPLIPQETLVGTTTNSEKK